MGRRADNITEAAIEAAGGTSALARALSITPGAVSQWERIPSDHVGPVARLTGIPAHVLRPDLFTKPEAA